MELKVVQIVFPQPAGMTGGTQTHVLQLITDQIGRDNKLTVLSGRSTEFTKMIHNQVEVFELFDNKEKINFSLLIAAIKRITELNPTVIHSHGYEANWLAFLLKQVQSFRGRRTVWIATIHGWLKNSTKERIKAVFDKISLIFTDGIIAVSNGQIEQCWLPKHQPWRIIPNGVDIEYFMRDEGTSSQKEKFRQHWNLPLNAQVIGTAGRLSIEKGQDVFCKVASFIMKSKSNSWFLIAGNGPEEKNIKLLIQALGIENRVVFVGNLIDMRGFYSCIDLFLLTSHTEGTPRVIAEAMASGLPIVSTAVGGVKILIPPQLSHMVLAPKNDVDRIGKCVLNILESPALQDHMSNVLLEYVKANFDSKKMVAEIERFYFEVLGGIS